MIFEQVLADMRERAAVARDAAKHNPDGTVHHEAVADMLEHLAARAEEAHKAEVDFLQGVIGGLGEQLKVIANECAGLNRKIANYERLFAESPIGLIYQLGICNQDGDVMNGIGILFTNEAERAKMPRVGHGDKLYVVPMELAHKVKGVVA